MFLKKSTHITAAALAAACALGAAGAMPGERSGKEVVETFCLQCHGAGVEGAPKIGDTKAWKARTTRGLTSLTDSAIAGVRRMPPHGGTLQINDLEIKRAITYMANQSGVSWADPIDRSAPAADRRGEDIVKTQCMKCHGTGTGGSPRIGDKAAWVKRAQPGLDSLVRSAIHGHGGMPSRGGMADLSDPEIRAAVGYMLRASLNEKK